MVQASEASTRDAMPKVRSASPHPWSNLLYGTRLFTDIAENALAALAGHRLWPTGDEHFRTVQCKLTQDRCPRRGRARTPVLDKSAEDDLDEFVHNFSIVSVTIEWFGSDLTG